MNSTPLYTTITKEKVGELTFYFESIGNRTIDKVIQYKQFEFLGGRPVYNLGFGDYDSTIDAIVDDARSNNGDIQVVFNTVLQTIPIFFQKVPNALVFVAGSDSQEGYEEKCKLNCTDKKCQKGCYRVNQRINVYTGFIRRNYVELSKKYNFFGIQAVNLKALEPYDPIAKKLEGKSLFPRKIEQAKVFFKSGINISGLDL